MMSAIPIGWQFLHNYQKNRILTFLNPENDPLGAGYHILQSKIALGSGGLLLVGSVFLHRLRRIGAYLCTLGALVGLIGGVAASLMVRTSARAHLQDAVVTTYEAWVYICGVTMGLCLAVAALPLLNLRASMALQPVRMVVNDESE